MADPTPEAVALADELANDVAHCWSGREPEGFRAGLALALTEQAEQECSSCVAWSEQVAEQARKIERLRAALTFIQGNYQPACPFCVEHRYTARAAQGGSDA
jgi:predicted anti-sigma-YlaC factor YlaD